MKKKTRSVISIVISIIIAVFLVYWLYTAVDFKKSWAAVKRANFWYVGISFLLGATAYWFRSQRWRLLLDSIAHPIGRKQAFAAVCINYFMNLIIPRSGEVARCATTYKTNNIPIDESFGTVVIERVIDFVCLFIVIGLTLIFEFDLILHTIQTAWQENQNAKPNFTPYYVSAFLFGLLLLVAYLFRKRILRTTLANKIVDFLKGIKKGLLSVTQLKQRKSFVVYTVLIWLFYYLMTWLVVFAFEESSHLNWADGLFLLVAGGIGMVIPASGGIGSYHAAISLAFVALGLSYDLGTSFAFVIHTPHSILAILLGIYSYAFINRTKEKII